MSRCGKPDAEAKLDAGDSLTLSDIKGDNPPTTLRLLNCHVGCFCIDLVNHGSARARSKLPGLTLAQKLRVDH